MAKANKKKAAKKAMPKKAVKKAAPKKAMKKAAPKKAAKKAAPKKQQVIETSWEEMPIRPSSEESTPSMPVESTELPPTSPDATESTSDERFNF